MTTTVINIGVTDEAEALLNEELKKIEGYTSHVVTNNGFNSQLIVFGTEATEAEDSGTEEVVDDGGDRAAPSFSHKTGREASVFLLWSSVSCRRRRRDTLSLPFFRSRKHTTIPNVFQPVRLRRVPRSVAACL